MDKALAAFLVTVAALSALPAWLTGSILKREALKDGVGGWVDWIPFGILGYALTRFRHRNRAAILWGYLFSNLLFVAALIAFVVAWRSAKA